MLFSSGKGVEGGSVQCAGTLSKMSLRFIDLEIGPVFQVFHVPRVEMAGFGNPTPVYISQE